MSSSLAGASTVSLSTALPSLSMVGRGEVWARAAALVPPMESSSSSSSPLSSSRSVAESRKGQHGRVGIVGGSFEYTGAPFYAALAALRTGADLAFVFCSRDAAVPIKSYSPELIVLPLLRTVREHEDDSRYRGLKEVGEDVQSSEVLASSSSSSSSPASSSSSSASSSSSSSSSSSTSCAPSFSVALVRELSDPVVAMLSRLDSLVVGPGLGRDALVLATVAEVVSAARERGIPVVFDADGLFLVQQRPSLVQGMTRALLTPNAGEFARLASLVPAAEVPDVSSSAPEASSGIASGIAPLVRWLDGPTVLVKGAVDAVVRAGEAVAGEEPGSPRRCGGQGDVLAGVAGAFLAWARRRENATEATVEWGRSMLGAGWAASAVTRAAARRAFAKHRRATTTPDILTEVGGAFEDVFEPRG